MRLLPVLAAALVLAAPAAASEQHPTLNELENQIMCPVCAGETLAQSDSAAAAQVKRYIQGRIAAGATRSEIKRKLVAHVRHADPGRAAAARVRPARVDAAAVGILGGAGAIGLLAWRWSRVREEPPAGSMSMNGRPLDPDLERRLDEELARFDG